MQPIFPKECKGPDCKGPQPIYYEERREFKLTQPAQPVSKKNRLPRGTHQAHAIILMISYSTCGLDLSNISFDLAGHGRCIFPVCNSLEETKGIRPPVTINWLMRLKPTLDQCQWFS